MSLFTMEEMISKQPLLDADVGTFCRETDSWDGIASHKDIIFEEFCVDEKHGLVSTILPDGYSAICIEFDANGSTSPCYFGRMKQLKAVSYTKNKCYFVIKIPPNYIFDTCLPACQLVNRVSRLEKFTDAFQTFPWKKFTTLTFRERITLFQTHVSHAFPYRQHPIINFILEESLACEAPSIKSLAAQLGISDRYIRQLFTDLLGSSPKQVIQAVRLQQAVSRILDQSKNVTDAYLETDFYDHPHFNKFFKHQTTYSPTEFKDLIQ